MGVIPLSDASRRPFHLSLVTASIIVVNLVAFGLEVAGGEAFVTRWALVPADVVAGRRWITVLTAMFLHGSVSHLVGNRFSCGPSGRRSRT
jgi:membrane associated rhomboid family serine protease